MGFREEQRKSGKNTRRFHFSKIKKENLAMNEEIYDRNSKSVLRGKRIIYYCQWCERQVEQTYPFSATVCARCRDVITKHTRTKMPYRGRQLSLGTKICDVCGTKIKGWGASINIKLCMKCLNRIGQRHKQGYIG